MQNLILPKEFEGEMNHQEQLVIFDMQICAIDQWQAILTVLSPNYGRVLVSYHILLAVLHQWTVVNKVDGYRCNSKWKVVWIHDLYNNYLWGKMLS